MKFRQFLLLIMILSGTIVEGALVSPDGAKTIYNPRITEKSVRGSEPRRGELLKPAKTVDKKMVLRINRAEHPFSELNQMSYGDLVDLLVTLDWQDIPGLFNSSTESIEFFKDSSRYQYLMDALDTRAKAFDGTADLGIPMLVEVLRAGSYIAWSEAELSYIKQGEPFVDRMEKPIISMASNSNVTWNNTIGVEIIKAMGYAMGIGVCSPEIMTAVTPLFTSFTDDLNSNLQDDKKRRAFYQIGNGMNHGFVNVDIFGDKDQAKADYSTAIANMLVPVKKLMDYGSMGEDYLYLINNGVWWYGKWGQISNDPETIAKGLLNVIDIYGKWEAPSLQALSLLTDSSLPYGDYHDLNEDEVKEELKAQLLPKYYRFDDGEFIFRCGADVTEKKVKQLYWALKEVRAQFLRYSLIDDALEQGHSDDSLTAIIYNNPDEYDNNNFLWGLSTNNGGMYIEGWGTFFTYERTPAQSIYTLEDLFRHELTHYLQGRFQTLGAWGQGIYANDRLTWFEEGGAEFTAGSSRLNGIPSRLNMVENLQGDGIGLMKLEDVVHATYSSGFTFYTFAFALFDYLHKNDIKTLFKLIKACNAGDAGAFDAIITSMKNNAALVNAYEDHKADLVANIGNLKNAGVTEDYFNVQSSKTISEVESDIGSVVALSDVETSEMSSNYFRTFKLKGTISSFNVTDTISDWYKMDSLANYYLSELTNRAWNGYKTTVCYFSDYRIEGGKAVFDVTFEGMLSPAQTPIAQKNLKIQNGIKIMRNSNLITVSLSGDNVGNSIRLYNIQGKLIKDYKVGENKKVSIQLNNISKGYYFLKVINGNNSIVQKINSNR